MLKYLSSLAIAGSLYWLAIRAARRCEVNPVATTDPRVWLDSRDQSHFAGQWVAIDRDTNERVSAAEHRQSVEHDLEVHHPERRCYLVRVPQVESDEPISVLLSVGPCKPDCGSWEESEAQR